MKKKILVLLTLMFTIFPVFADTTICNGADEEYMVSISACTNNGGIATKCGIPAGLADMINDAYNLIKIAVPITLIILGMIDMLKAVASQKEDEIKKGQKILLSRCIAAGITFFVVAIVQLLFSIVNGGTEGDSTWNCIDKFVNGAKE